MVVPALCILCVRYECTALDYVKSSVHVKRQNGGTLVELHGFVLDRDRLSTDRSPILRKHFLSSTYRTDKATNPKAIPKILKRGVARLSARVFRRRRRKAARLAVLHSITAAADKQSGGVQRALGKRAAQHAAGLVLHRQQLAMTYRRIGTLVAEHAAVLAQWREYLLLAEALPTTSVPPMRYTRLPSQQDGALVSQVAVILKAQENGELSAASAHQLIQAHVELVVEKRKHF
ncbi:MAG: hypothetical protein MHM6MM_002015 [Cercozoa sp. M6MM]